MIKEVIIVEVISPKITQELEELAKSPINVFMLLNKKEAKTFYYRTIIEKVYLYRNCKLKLRYRGVKMIKNKWLYCLQEVKVI